MIRVALEKVDFLPATRVTDDGSILTLKSLVMEPLCRWHDGVVGPGLFDRWHHDADGRHWVFHIRDGARFHDGKPCAGEDILAFIAGIRAARDMFGMPWSYARYFQDCDFTAPAAAEIHVRTALPFGDLPEIFSEFYISRPDPAGRPILGTGPYLVAECAPGQRALLEPCDRRHGADSLLMLAEPDADARLRLLRAGEVDVAFNLERTHELPVLTPDLHWGRAVHALSVICYLNGATGPFRAPSSRLAINHAIDKEDLIRTLLPNLAIPAASVVSPFHLGFAQAGITPVPFDRDAARRLLDQAPIEGELLLRTPTYMPERALEISHYIADALGKVGVRARVEVEPDRPAYAQQIGRKDMGDMAIFDSSPHSTFRVLNDKISSRSQGVWWQGHDDPALEADIAAANQTMDTSRRAAAYGQCLRRLRRNPPWLYLFHPVILCASRLPDRGIRPDSKGILRFPFSPQQSTGA